MYQTVYTKEYGEIRFGWIRLLYACTATLGITVGMTMLIAPEFSRKIVGFPFRLPEEDPIVYGALAGIWTTIGFVCLLGLRSPLKFLPIFAIQFFYKFAWFAFVFFPLAAIGEFPAYGWASAIGNLIWMILDIIAIPWGYLFATDDPLRYSTIQTEMHKYSSSESSQDLRVT
ncbi:MAG: hypothetical protein NTY15_00110 [Planctomycetota bacterium]|nr:hypothetical protein [Planctomycetota bacterium]